MIVTYRARHFVWPSDADDNPSRKPPAIKIPKPPKPSKKPAS